MLCAKSTIPARHKVPKRTRGYVIYLNSASPRFKCATREELTTAPKKGLKKRFGLCNTCSSPRKGHSIFTRCSHTHTPHHTTPHHTTPHHTTPHHTTPHHTTPHHTTPHHTTPHHTTQHNTTQHNTTQHNTTQHNTHTHTHTTPHHTTPHHTTPHHTTPHHTTPHHTTHTHTCPFRSSSLKIQRNVSHQTPLVDLPTPHRFFLGASNPHRGSRRHGKQVETPPRTGSEVPGPVHALGVLEGQLHQATLSAHQVVLAARGVFWELVWWVLREKQEEHHVATV